jgi:hypothetical protein
MSDCGVLVGCIHGMYALALAFSGHVFTVAVVICLSFLHARLACVLLLY